MSELKKSLLGLAAFWPIGYMIFFMVFIFSMMGKPHTAGMMNQWFPVIFLLHFATIFSILGQTIYYAIHIMKKNTQLDDTSKIIWVLMMFFMNMLAIPVYWFMYISKDDEYGYA